LSERAETHGAGGRRRALLDELRAVEREWLRVREGLAALGPGERLPGLHLVVRLAAGRLLLPCARVAEIARIVACDPIPGAPRWVLGTFVWRGRPAVAVDLEARLGGAPAGSLEAMMVVLDGTPTIAVVVSEIGGLAEDPLLAQPGGATPADRFVLGAALVDGETIPVLAPELLEREAQEAA
jgi:purine-binding chemotaxis protein CheW